MNDRLRSTDYPVIAVYLAACAAVLYGVAFLGISEWWFTLPLPLVFHFGLHGKRVLAHSLLIMLVIPAFLVSWWKESQALTETSIQIVAIGFAVSVLIEVVRREFNRREAMNRRIRESEEAYRRLFEGMKDGIAYIERDLRPTLMNDHFSELSGFSREELSRINFLDLVAPEDRERIRRNAERRFLGEEVERTYEFRAIRKSGETIVVEGSFDPVRNGDRIVGIQVMVRDITERKRALEALRESEERYSMLFEGAEEGIALYGRGKTRPLLMNRRFTEICGYTREEMENIDPIDLVHPEDRARLLENNRKRLAGEEAPRTYEYRSLHKDGRVLNLEASFDAIRKDGEIIGIQGFFRDITERKKAEEELRESSERFRVLFEAANDSIAVFDENVRPILYNQKFKETLGYTDEEIASLNLVDLVHPDDREEVLRRNRMRFMGEDVARTYEVRVLKKSGEVMVVEGSFDTVHLGGKKRIQGILRDITERKLMERKLFEKQKERTLTTLAGGIAHDFNNILLGIMGNAGLLKDEVPRGSDAEEMLNSILSSADRLAKLTKELLDYSRASLHQPRNIDVNRVVTDAVDMFRGSLGSNVKLEVDLSPSIPKAQADAPQIQQVLLNLFLNANEAMPNGGTLRVRTRNRYHAGGSPSPHPQMELATGDYLVIEIEDDGLGMSAETLNQAFDPFYTTKFLGRGLGLAASAGIIQIHKGAIRAESEPGKGSLFTVYLPSAAEPQSSDPAPRLPEIPSEGSKILIVDDDVVVRGVTEKMFEKMGFQTLSVEDGEAALEVFEREHREIQLVFLDIQIPGIGGAEVFARMLEIDPSVRVVVNSGYDEAKATAGMEDKDRLAGFIQKPYTARELQSLVESLEAHA